MAITTHSDTASILNVCHTAIDFTVPDGACDCHVHVFGPRDLYPYWEGRKFTPGPASADELIEHQKVLHLQRVVIVQPSAYGSDNRCMLDAMKHLGESVRGVVVIDKATSPAELASMYASGVRGDRKSTRLNSSHQCATRKPSTACTKKKN